MKSKVNNTRKSNNKKIYRTRKNNNKNTITKEPKKKLTNNATKKIKKYQKGSGPGNNALANSYEPDSLLPIIAAQLSSIIYSNHDYILFIINLIGASISESNYIIFKKSEDDDYENFNKQLLQLKPNLEFNLPNLPDSIDFFDIYI